MVKSKIWIESKDFEDRTELRVVINNKYPKGYRKGMYEEYLGYWEATSYGGSRRNYVFIAYKKELSLFRKLFGYNDYRNQSRIAVQRCDKLIREYKKHNEIPKIQRYDR